MTDWNPATNDWRFQQRCLKCGLKLFPYSSQDAERWSEYAYHECQRRNISPKQLMYERSPNIDKTHATRPPKVIYY
ncbi:MAG: hypothetical protein JJ829_005125 [Prochlorococcus marinus XMU1420]|uniref:Uncharacterized protein n=1 Tax=Prochlorococcus marinus XMU1424 TaxID=2774497 RepID=A0A9D9BZM2_PROMR|nr:hypothetical protein [Prochlorococcus marinus XMU1420]MCR8535793.1 hypothetical protein [Prochlorococcus marinus XMU1424]